jgi:photosystem II stability/assembly factor-like uncharacterized protein
MISGDTPVLNRQRTILGVVSLAAMAVGAVALMAAPRQGGGRSSIEQALAGMTWRFVGPFRGGRTLAVSGVVGDARTFYLGAVDGGVWKTVDAGQSWTPIFDEQPVQSIGALEVAPANPDVIYVGTGEGCIRNDISYGNGMYKSTDAGKTWSHIGLDDSQHIPRLAIDPKNPDRVFVAVLGHASGPNPERGVYRTLDGGKTWQRVLFKDDQTGAVDLSFDPADSNVIYAALYQQIRMPWGASSGGPGSGLYKSTDGGDHWTELTGHGLPGGVLGKIGVAVGADSKTVYAQIEAKDGGLYVSKDAGASWTLVNDSDNFRQRAWYFTHVFADPKNPEEVYELNTGVSRSTDGGKTFRSIHGGDSHGLWIDPTATDRIITSSDGGAFVSVNGGQTWTSTNNQATAQYYHVATDDQTYWELYGEQQDSGSIGIPSHTDHGAIYASDAHGVGGGESGWAVPSPDGKYVYAGNYMALSRWEKDGGTQSINPWPENSMGWGAATLQHRFQWTAPIALSPFDSNTVYYGGEILYKSTDRGSHWTKISKDLTRNDKSKQQSSGGPITQDNTSAEYYDVIFCIAESPVQQGLIWIGTDDGLVQLTRDAGKTWTDVTPPELKEYPQKEWAKIGMVAPSPFDAGTVYVAARRNKMDDFAPYIYKTSDYGRTWTKIVSGIPTGSYVNSVKPDTQKRGLLFAATELGVYTSLDDGTSWQPLQFNLPHASVRDLVVHGDSLAIATHGRAFWILDDISPLRDWTGQAGVAPVTLFKPPVVYRERGGGRGGFGGFRGRGGGPQYSGLSTPNPPEGPVFVDYALSTKPTGPVTIAILDPDGHTVRTYSSADNVAPGAAPEPPAAGRGGRGGRGRGGFGFGGFAAAPVNVPVEVGFNRFAAPLPTPETPEAVHCIPNEVLWGGGGRGGGAAVVPVGTFSVKLTVDGRSYTQPLRITMDPKLHVSDADMMEQYSLATKVAGQADALHDAVNDMLSLQKQLADLPNGKALSDKMQAVIEVMANLHSTSGEDPLNYAIGLDNKLADFAGSVLGGEGKPTEGMMEVYNDLEPQYTAIMARWKQIQTTDIPAFNDQQKASGGKTIAPGPRPTSCGGRGRGGGM